MPTPPVKAIQHAPRGPFWHWKPRHEWTEKERQQYAALQFSPVDSLERALIVRDTLPAIFRRWSIQQRMEVESYAKQRAAKVELGEWKPPEPDQEVVAELRAAAAELEGLTPTRIDAITREHRAAYQAAVAGGGDAIAALVAWTRAVAVGWAELARYAHLMQLVGLRYQMQMAPPIPNPEHELGLALSTIFKTARDEASAR